MDLKFSIVILGAILIGCSIANNQIGYEVLVDKPTDKRCVESALTAINGIKNFSSTEIGSRFKTKGYDIIFVYKIDNAEIIGYNLDIDGMFLGEDTGQFYSNAEDIRQGIHEAIKVRCS